MTVVRMTVGVHPTVGSLQNLLASQSVQAHAEYPKVGDGATVINWTDRQPGTIVEVVSPRHVRVQLDKAEYAFPSGAATSIAPDPNGYIEEVRRGKDGRWAISKQRSTTVLLGVRDAYYDHSF